MKDDHDTWLNDCWPTMPTAFMGEFTFRQGQAAFREQVPVGKSTYRTVRWGKELQIWMVEGRDFRSPLTMADGPEKTIWGKEQKQWFKETVRTSDATFRVLISPTPIVGPDRPTKKDNHANAGYSHEGKELREFLAEQKMVVLCGDRHWQYQSVDPATGVREYSVGPGSDPHAGGWKQEDYFPGIHRFLRVSGGFLSVNVDRTQSVPTMSIRFHDTDGNIKYEDVVRRQ
jgi:alkaline phosphatase D